MTYAKLILPYNPREYQVTTTPKQKLSLKGKLSSAWNNARSAVKGAIQNPGQTMTNLGKYLQQNEDAIVNKFSGIAIAQLLVDGRVTNKQALDYLFLGAFPALNQTYTALGYSGIQQMKQALANGTINVGNFVNGLTKTLKSITDLKNKVKNIDAFEEKNIIEIDITYSHEESYMSETGDRRVQEGITWAEFIHNLPETFSLSCGIQDGKRYTVQEFKDMLKYLRKKKVPFNIEIDGELTELVVLQNFRPIREGATNGLEYNLEFKKVRIGRVESADVVIQLPPTVNEQTTSTGTGSGSGSARGGSGSLSTSVVTPKVYTDNNPYIDAMMNKPERTSTLYQLRFGGR